MMEMEGIGPGIGLHHSARMILPALNCLIATSFAPPPQASLSCSFAATWLRVSTTFAQMN